MPTIKEVIEKQYPEQLKKLQKNFPGMYELSKKIKAVFWEDIDKKVEKQADPKALEEIKFAQMMFKNNLMSVENYTDTMENLFPGYIDKIYDILMSDDSILFKSTSPKLFEIIESLGEKYFKEESSVWLSYKEGGALLILTHLFDDVEFTEKDVKEYMRFKRLISLAPLSKIRKIEREIAEYISKYLFLNYNKQGYENSLLPYLLELYKPLYLQFEKGKELIIENNFEPFLTDMLIGEEEIILKETSIKMTIHLFISKVLESFREPHKNTYPYKKYKEYGNAFFHFLPAINKTIAYNLNKTVFNIEELEKEFEKPEIAHFIIALGIEKDTAIQNKDKIEDIIKDTILTPLTSNLPVDEGDILISSTNLAVIKPEAAQRIKQYIKISPNLKLPELTIDILKENNVL